MDSFYLRQLARLTDIALGPVQRIPKGLKCVERREAGRGAGVHAPQAEFTFRTYVGDPEVIGYFLFAGEPGTIGTAANTVSCHKKRQWQFRAVHPNT